MLENDAGLIVAALVDERGLVGRAGVDIACLILDHERMPGPAGVLIEEVSTPSVAEIAPVEFTRRIGHRSRDDRVVIAVEQINFLPFDVVERIDRSGCCLCFQLGDHRLQVGRRITFHARPRRGGDRQGIQVDDVRGARLRAVERPAGHHPDALDDGRPGEPKLNSHERAGRYSRNGAVADRRVVRLQLPALRPGGGACRRDGERDRDSERAPRIAPWLRKHGDARRERIPRSAYSARASPR